MVFEIRLDQLLPDHATFSHIVRLRAGAACEKCGASDVRLAAHHKDHDPKNHRLENGVCLCVSCHNREHGTFGWAGPEPDGVKSERARRGWETRRKNGKDQCPSSYLTPEQLKARGQKAAATRKRINQQLKGTKV